jgi:hypothetical protein
MHAVRRPGQLGLMWEGSFFGEKHPSPDVESEKLAKKFYLR